MKRLVLTVAILIGLAAPAWAGLAEGVAAYERGDYATALREFRLLASQGHASAQSNLGVMYEKGRGVPQNYAEAVKWYRKAVGQDDISAQYNHGLMYNNGRGVTQDYVEAVRWYRKAAKRGHARAQTNLGFLYGKGQGIPQDYVQAHMWLNLAASHLPPGADHGTAVKNRDILAARMTTAQIAEAQRLARGWKPQKERQTK